MVLLIYAHVCIIIATLAMLNVFLVFTKLSQNSRVINLPVPILKFRPYFFYNLFWKENVATVQHIVKLNLLLSRALTVYILVNSPIKGMLTAIMLVMKQPNSSTVNLFTTPIILHQWFCTFGIHMILAALNEYLHRPSRRMLNLVAVDSRLNNNLRLKIKITNYISAFHVQPEKRYGITYWNGSLITMNTFIQVSTLLTDL